MCGIGGIVEFKSNKIVSKELLSKINELQKHRGPDASGIWINKNKTIGFSHTRLSILDISKKANQPFFDRNYVLTFNGEIYNFKEIKQILKNKGYRFTTSNSDTEVLLFAYKEWKTDCLSYLRGMFAFAIWDNLEKKLWLVRDRVGVKPLYYKKNDERLIFASEIKAILLDDSYKAEIDEESLFHYLSFLCTPAPNTMFKGIKKLEAGSWLLIDKSGKIKKKKYWDPLKNKKNFVCDESNFKSEILKELENSVKLRTISDVDVGVFLSGGIDSSTNAALFSKSSKSRIKTFSIGYDKIYKSYKSELQYAKLMSQYIKSEHFEKKLNKKNLVEIIEKMIFHQDEPISDPVCFPIYYVSKLAISKKVKVCQVGEGADELFFGYSNWARTIKLNKIFNNFLFFRIFKKVLKFFMTLFKLDHIYSHDLLSRSIKRLPIFWSGAEAFSESEKKRILSERMKKKFINRSSWKIIEPYFKIFNKTAKYNNLANWMTYIDLKLRLPELLLMRIDKMSMACGLEARVPFLDHVLISKMIDIPKDIKFKNQNLKCLLKDCVKGLIPDIIINRKKQGFGLPLKDWFSDGLGINEGEIVMSFVRETNYFDENEVQKIISKRKSDTRIWFLLNLAIWWKIFIQKKTYLNFVNSK